MIRKAVLVLAMLASCPAVFGGGDSVDSRWSKLEHWKGPSGSYVVLSDAEVFAALDLDRPGLGRVKELATAKRYDEAYLAWGEYWASRKTPCWLFEPDVYVSAMKKSMPWVEPVITGQAEDVLGRNISTGPYQAVPKGRFIDWAVDNGKSEYVGFHYFFWLPSVPRAYLLTHDEKYARAFVDIACSWYDALPDIERFEEVVWNRQLGSSLRCLFLAEGYSLMRRSPSFTPELHAKMLRILLGHARYVCDVHMQEYSDWNGQNSGLAMLACVGSFVPELRESAAWRGRASEMARLHIDRNFHEDGGQKELCTQYHMTGLRDLGWAVRALRAVGDDSILSDPALKSKFREAFNWPMKLGFGSGFTPALNSGVVDKEWIAHAAIGAKLFDDPTLRWAVRRYAGKTYLPVTKNLITNLLDDSFADALDTRLREEPPAFKSLLLGSSGFAVMRDGWDADSLCMVVDYGTPWGGHGYPGKLSFTLWGRGALMAAHPGSPVSYSLPVYRDWCYQTRSHNTVEMAGQSQKRPFSAQMDHWQDLGKVVFFCATTDVSQPAKHTRAVSFVPGEYFMVFDHVTGAEAGASAKWMLHSPPGLGNAADGSARGPELGPGLLVLSPKEEIYASVETGAGHGAVPVEWSPAWKQLDAWRDDIAFVNWTKPVGPTGTTFTFAMLPYSDKPRQASLESVPVHAGGKELPQTDCRAVIVRLGETCDVHLCVFGEDQLRSFAGIETDARRVWLRRNGSGGLVGVCTLGGTRLVVDGEPVAVDSLGSL